MKSAHSLNPVGALALATLLGAAAASAEQFTLAVIPDTQNYCDTANPTANPQPASVEIYQREMLYLASQKTAQNIVFATHVGDVVQHGDLYDAEWQNAKSAMDILAASGIPFGMSPGNHDYDNYSHTTGSRPLTGSLKWNQYFGPGSHYFAHKHWYGGSYNGGLDSFQTFRAAGQTFLHVSLQLEASADALAWANEVIAAYPGLPTIVTTHEYLSYQNATNGKALYLNDGYLGTMGNSAQGVWDKFISQNDQIFLVICGHNWSPTLNGVSDGKNPNTTAANIIKQLDQQFINHGVKLVVAVGDMVDTGSQSNDYVRALYAQDLYNAGIGFYPTRGNHEAAEGTYTGSAADFRYAYPQIVPGPYPGFNNTTPWDITTALVSPSSDLANTPPASPLGTAFAVGLDFTAPTAANLVNDSVSYAFNYNNVTFMLLDQFHSPDYYTSHIPEQMDWINATLSARPANTHAFAFTHKNILGGNHKDNMFGGQVATNDPGDCFGVDFNSLAATNQAAMIAKTNAVHLNSGGTPQFVSGPWQPGYPLGTYGFDAKSKTAWAVLNHNGEFAVTTGIQAAADTITQSAPAQAN